MNRPLFVIISFCLIVFMASFYVAVWRDSTPAYSLAVTSFAFSVALYAVGFLGYKFGGSVVSLEAKVQNLETEASELKKSVSSLLKSIYVLEHGLNFIDGPSAAHYKLVATYLEPISHLVSPDLREQVLTEIEKAIRESAP